MARQKSDHTTNSNTAQKNVFMDLLTQMVKFCTSAAQGDGRPRESSIGRGHQPFGRLGGQPNTGYILVEALTHILNRVGSRNPENNRRPGTMPHPRAQTMPQVLLPFLAELMGIVQQQNTNTPTVFTQILNLLSRTVEGVPQPEPVRGQPREIVNILPLIVQLITFLLNTNSFSDSCMGTRHGRNESVAGNYPSNDSKGHDSGLPRSQSHEPFNGVTDCFQIIQPIITTLFNCAAELYNHPPTNVTTVKQGERKSNAEGNQDPKTTGEVFGKVTNEWLLQGLLQWLMPQNNTPPNCHSSQACNPFELLSKILNVAENHRRNEKEKKKQAPSTSDQPNVEEHQAPSTSDHPKMEEHQAPSTSDQPNVEEHQAP